MHNSKRLEMQQMAFWLFISLPFLMIEPTDSFNLDARYFSEIRQNPNQYFGYSIGFRKHSNQYKILVGSPKANDTKLHIVSGALYECNIEPPYDCRMIKLNLYTGLNISRQDQWLGVALDISPFTSNIIVCAHRLREHFSYADSVCGACYEINDTTSAQKATQYSQYYYNPNYGISCRYSQQGQLLIGVPGIRTSSGGYFQKPILYTNTGNDLYEGYTVTFLDEIPVIGKPRYGEYGAVDVQNELVVSPENKYSFGSYFGSAIAVADLNQDGQKDLVIGAPFYSKTFTEEGRVYIYFYDTVEGLFYENASLELTEPSYRAQFGKSLVTGDFNSDKYQDVIVGAPYENEGTGCIYIYNGKYGGLDLTYSQKINGESLRKGLRSFGISFTRAVDLDRNRYADIGVGAYLSDSVYIFKARPTYSVTTQQLVASDRILDLVPKCIFNDRLVLCVNLTVTLALSTASEMQYNLHLITDSSKTPEEKRTYFNGRQHEVTEPVTVRPPYFRKVYQIFIKSTKDIMSPINFTLHYSLKDQGYSASCQPLCPISKSGTITETIKFNLECGSDEICQTRLKVKLESSPPNITLGKDKKLMAAINVFNLGEHAYNARARIFFSPFMDFELVNKPTSVECTSVNKMELSCFLGNPLRENDNRPFVLTFSLGLTPNVTEAFVAVNASTDSQVEPKYLVNTVNLTIRFYREFDLDLVATSVPDTLAFTGKDGSVTAKHVYHLRNNGPSNAFRLIFSVDIPYVVINNSPLMTIKEYRMLDGKNRNALNLVSNDSVCRLNKVVDAAAEPKTDIKSLLKHGNIASCSWLKCHRIVCELSRLPTVNTKIFDLALSIDTKILKQFQNKLRFFDVVSNGTLRHTMSDQIIKVHHDQANATTSFLISRLRKKIQWWIVVCSIIIGLIFLIIVGVVLWKFGFFRRDRVSAEDRRSLAVAEDRRSLAVAAKDSAPSESEPAAES